MRPAAGPRSRNDLGHAVAGHVPGRHADAARERRVVGEEARDLRHDAARQAEGAHVRPAAGPRPRNDLRHAVARQIPGRHGDPARERRVVREEARDLRHDAAREAEGAHVRPAAGPCSR